MHFRYVELEPEQGFSVQAGDGFPGRRVTGHVDHAATPGGLDLYEINFTEQFKQCPQIVLCCIRGEIVYRYLHLSSKFVGLPVCGH